MESFVPFGGLFSTLSDFSGSRKSIPRCHMCDDKCEEEINAVTKGGVATSVADQYWSTLPSWLQMADLDVAKEFHAKVLDDFYKCSLQYFLLSVNILLHSPLLQGQSFKIDFYSW